MQCPCCSFLPYEICCAPLHKGVSPPKDSLALMRSRYSAYVLQLHQYIVDTYVQEERRKHHVDAIKRSFQNVHWKKLEILSVQGTRVSFAAYYDRDGSEYVVREDSAFLQEDGMWKYCERDSRMLD